MRSVTFIIPALDEEAALEATVRGALAAADGRGMECEVVIVDDASTDGTPQLADRLAGPRVRVLHNARRRGVGYAYWAGVRASTKEAVMLVPGDGECPSASVAAVLEHAGACDVVAPFPLEDRVRPWPRRLLSRLFVFGVNRLFKRGLRYYNGECLVRRELLERVAVRTEGPGYMAAIVLQLLDQGVAVRELGIPMGHRAAGASKAVSAANAVSVARVLWRVRRARQAV